MNFTGRDKMKTEYGPKEILFGFANFDDPARKCYLKDAKELVKAGILTQEQLDNAWKIGSDKIDAKDIEMYGVKNPTTEQIFERGFRELGKLDFPKNFVSMNDGRYTSGEKLITTVAGCTL